MGLNAKLRFLVSTIALWLMIPGVPISVFEPWVDTEVQIGTEAWARRSGGRSRGGSFGSSGSGGRSRGSGSRSSGSSSGGSSSGSRSSGSSGGSSSGSRSSGSSGSSGRSNPSYRTSPNYRPSAPVYGYGTRGGSAFSWIGLSLGLLILGGPLLIAYLIFQRASQGYQGSQVSPVQNEIDNDIVTVSKLQVALLSPEGDLQQQLTELTLNGDTETPEGLFSMLQEAALAVMRRSDRWCYVSSSSQTVKSREQAQQVFEQLSIEERSKLTSETLVNVNGAVKERIAALSQELSDPGSYVVVTLLVGTADDQPLFKDIQTSEALQQTLGRLGGISPEYLLVFELLWSPQEEHASLSSDELLTSYSEMLPL